MEQKDAVFETVVTGKPQPKVEWFRGGVSLVPSESVVIETYDDKSTLTLKSCQVYQTGSISVKATNEAGSDSAVAKFNVQGPVVHLANTILVRSSFEGFIHSLLLYT